MRKLTWIVSTAALAALLWPGVALAGRGQGGPGRGGAGQGAQWRNGAAQVADQQDRGPARLRQRLQICPQQASCPFYPNRQGRGWGGGGRGGAAGAGNWTCPNPNAPDADGDGIPNGQDPDYRRPRDGRGPRGPQR